MISVDFDDQEAWERFNLEHHPASFLQSWAGGEWQGQLGKKIIRRGYLRRGKLAAIALLIREESRRGLHLLCPGGPVLDFKDQEATSYVMRDLVKIEKKEQAIFLRVRPNVLDSLELRQVFRRLGFHPAPMHLTAETTWELTLLPSESELLGKMRSGTRQVIQKTRSAGVKIERSTAPADADLLDHLQQETVRRHHFVPFPPAYFQGEAKAFLPDNLLFFKAFWQDELWAIALVVYYGRAAVYHYAAAKAYPPGLSPPSLILWEAICEAKKRGCSVFNFWGVAPSDDPRHRFAGVTKFKQGFGGQRVFYLPAHDRPIGWGYWPVFAFETLRRVWRRL